MSRELLLPELAESVVEGEIVRWLVAEGEHVAEEQPVVEVMTDKVTVELPSPFAGVLEQYLAAEGDVVVVGAPIARFAEGSAGTQPVSRGEVASPAEDIAAPPQVMTQDGSEGSAPVVTAEAESGQRASDPDDGSAQSLFKASRDDDAAPVFQVQRPVRAPSPTTPPTNGQTTGPYGRPVAVPAARKLARELGLELSAVTGSGPNGRIRVADVQQAAESQAGSRARPAATPGVKSPVYKTPAGFEEREERIPVRGLRRAILGQMVASHLNTVRTLHVDEADVSALVALRARLKPRAEGRGVKLSYIPFIMKAVVAALKRYPVLNSSLDEAASEIVVKHFYNLGLAVATDVGLVVPVIREVDRKGILELAAEVSALATKARDGKLAPEDVRGGTFSVTNIGSLGGLFSFPIINVPEAAILGVHSIKKRPVVLPDDTIVAREMLYLSLSFDHRVIDGAEAAQFTSALIDLLETPEALLLES